MIETRPKKTHERALLIGLEKQGVSKWDLQDSLEELAELANSAGAEVVDTVTQKLQKPTAPYYIGKGKAEPMKDSLQVQQVTSVIFERELEAVRKTRAVQRQGRKRRQWPVAAVVGYTNAGKSTLLNLLTGADLVTENRLFATLDPTTRSFVLPNKQRVLVTDTVGFLRKLPHTLIESFKATLEEVSEADLLIHIVDLSHPRVDEQMEAVDAVIKELDAFGKQTLIVFNKIDNLESRELAEIYVKRFPGSVAISARTGEGVTELVQALQGALGSWRLRSRFRIPVNESALIAEIHRVGHVLELRYEDDVALIVAHVPPHLEQKLAAYAVRD